MVPDRLAPGGFAPPNTWEGIAAMERLLPRQYHYEALAENSRIRHLCDNEDFYLGTFVTCLVFFDFDRDRDSTSKRVGFPVSVACLSLLYASCSYSRPQNLASCVSTALRAIPSPLYHNIELARQ